MKKIKFLIPVIALFIIGCDNYLDINDNTNSVPGESVTPKHIFPGAATNAYRVQAVTMNELGNVFMNSWSANVNSFTGGFTKEYQLTIDNSFRNGIWNGLYPAISSFNEIAVYPNADGKWDYYVAAAKVMKAYYMQYIVDLYGDAPYTEAFLGQANMTPKYTDDQAIYRSLLTGLQEARDLITNADPSIALNMGTADVIFGGDTSKWYNFANTVELKMLMRMSNNTGAVAAYRDAKLAALSGASFITTPVMINPGFNTSTNDQLNPFFGNYMTDAAGARLSNNQFICASNHIARFVNGVSTEIIPGSGRNYPGLIDARRGRMWRLSGGTVKGVTQGATSGTPEASNPVSFLGYYSFVPYLNVAVQIPTSSYSQTLPMAASAGVIMTKAEIEFLQAEAAVRYPAWFSGASTHFTNGVTDGFAIYGLTPGTYLTAIASKPGLGWTASTTNDLKYEAIMTQKWLATIHFNAMDSFIDYNRTGYPLTPLALTASESRKPRRLIYPVSEYVANSANVPNITAAQIFATTDASHPFWMLGDPALGN